MFQVRRGRLPAQLLLSAATGGEAERVALGGAGAGGAFLEAGKLRQ